MDGECDSAMIAEASDASTLLPVPFTTAAFAIGEEVTMATHAAIQATLIAFHAWIKVGYLIMQPVGHLAALSWPTVRAAIIYGAKRFASQPKEALAAEAISLLILIGLWRLFSMIRRRRFVARARQAVQRRYNSILMGVRRRSLLYAAALPHLLFFAACAGCLRVFTKLGLRSQVADVIASVEPWLSTALPAARSLLALNGTSDEQLLWLRYWVVWGSGQLCIGLIGAIPFALRLARAAVPLVSGRLPIFHEVPFCFYLWLQLPGHRGLCLVYRTLAPMLLQRTARAGALVPAVPVRVKMAAHLGLVTALGEARSGALLEAVNDGSVLLVGLMFLLMPSPVASVGLTLLAFGSPLLRSINVVGEAAAAAQAKVETSAAGGAVGLLRYWVFYTMFCSVLHFLQPLLQWVPFMTHLQIIAIMWMQLPIFRSATRLVLPLLPSILSLRSRAPASHNENDNGTRNLTSPRVVPLHTRCTCAHHRS